MDFFVLIIFCLVYLGMILGTLPGFAIDRTGIALLGAIAFIEIRNLSLKQAVQDIDISSISMLFSFMIISAQLYFSGFYTRVAMWVENWRAKPELFLLFIVLISGVLSAALINDIVCLAMTPLLIRVCHKKKFNPVPFLIGLVSGSNIGSALTLVGNPQNMLIGQLVHIPFAKYTIQALVPCILGWFVAWWCIKKKTKEWYAKNHDVEIESPAYDAYQSLKGVIAIVLVLLIFLIFNVPRDHISLAIAGFLLLSRKMASHMMLSFIDWQLLVLFIGLFIVNQEFNRTDMMQSFLLVLENYQINLSSPVGIFAASVVLSNLISNVPAVMLLIPFAKDISLGTILALSSTLAGNMFIIGSIANIIVISQAANYGIPISWRTHLTYGLPISLVSLGITLLWFYLSNLLTI